MQTELEMAVSAVVADWSGARYVNGSNETLEDYMTKSRVEANMNTADYDLKEFVLNTENGVIVGYKDKDYNFTVEITSSGNSTKVIYEGNSESSGSGDEDIDDPDEENPGEEVPPVEEEESFADVVTEASHYGDYVDYPIDLNEDGNTANDWRIFYNDGEHIFIIAADYVKNNSTYINFSSLGVDRVGNYSVNWNLVPSSAQNVEENTLSLFKQSWTDYSTNSNGRCISTMLNTDNWTGLVNSTYADYAIGGATMEMWISSYNGNSSIPLYCNNTNNNGYYVGNINTPTTTYQMMENLGDKDSLYLPHREVYNNDCYGYFLATPSASSENSIAYVAYTGYIGCNESYRYILGIRPVVCLNAEVTAEYQNGVWTLSVPNV